MTNRSDYNPSTRKRTPPEVREGIVRMYRQTGNVSAVAREYNVDRRTVYHYLRAAGVQTVARPRSGAYEDDRNKVQVFYDKIVVQRLADPVAYHRDLRCSWYHRGEVRVEATPGFSERCKRVEARRSV